MLISRIGDISRFAGPRALANYFGLTPTCKNSGEQTKRLGGISEEGSKLVRFISGLMVTQVVRHDSWMRSFYRRIKKRRGAKIARVAVMRRLCTVIYRMIEKDEPYIPDGPTARRPSWHKGSWSTQRDAGYHEGKYWGAAGNQKNDGKRTRQNGSRVYTCYDRSPAQRQRHDIHVSRNTNYKRCWTWVLKV